ncbi:unnamed protein product [Urochloa decumbens]|uniref:Bifunctional inhibitor/plant lipid transfer protein/seed storage helical domain-containing protein n=1 Tax=Urochloa decumbens TaxID=240449 RepID=A0ABC8WHE8_9POAL
MARGARVTGAYLCCLLVVFAAIRSCSSSYEVQALKDDIMKHCRFNLEKNMGQPFPPREGACCEHVRSANVAQICQEFTLPRTWQKSRCPSGKWVTVARACENPLAVGFNCAGYIVPAA